jgi:hypothetical protein
MRTSKKIIPRGIRNNNPLNIRRTRTQWKGMTQRQTDPAFCQFSEMRYGLRAAFIVLHTYVTRHHLNTLRKVIGRWAPPPENNPSTYLLYICLRTGWPPNKPLPPMDAESVFWPLLVEAMAEEECGKDVMTQGLLKHDTVVEAYRSLTARHSLISGTASPPAPLQGERGVKCCKSR